MVAESSGYYLIDPDYNVIGMNKIAKNLYPSLEIGKKCYTCLLNRESPCDICPVLNGVKGPRTYVDPIRQTQESVDAIDVQVDGIEGDCHALVFSTTGENASFAATLPNSAADLKNLALIKALTINYQDVFSVNLNTEQITLYRHNGISIDDSSSQEQNLLYKDGIEDHIARYVHKNDQEKLRTQLSLGYIIERLRTTEFFQVHYIAKHNNELHYYYRTIVRIGPADSFENVVVGVVCEDDEILSHKQQEELELNLRNISRDSLTGLYTKELFILNSQKLLREYPDISYDLCVFKLENLGLINHQYGYQTGDKLLALIGRLLQAYEEDNNCIAYIKDGIFISLTVNTEDSVRRSNIMQFRQDILQQSEIKTISPKWSIYKNIDRSIPLMEIYDKTLYALSTIRFNLHEEYVEFDQKVFHRMEEEFTLEKEFERSLDDGSFVLQYQPKFSSKTQRIAGAESLARWRRKDGSYISPTVFIPVLERCGKINQLDSYVFEQTCKMQKKLRSLGLKEIPISVNLSRASMFTEDISQQYSTIAASYELPAGSIPIEITESVAVRATEIRTFASDLIQKGFSLHMDDFGSGYSSLASLSVIPFETIKIDKSLIDYIGKENSESLLRHVISYAHEQGISVVAEGVETYEQYLFLKYAGCDSIQGYYYSKPLWEDELIELLG